MDGRIRPLLLASIDEALDDLLGIRVRQNIYNCLQRGGICREDIPNNLDHLVAFLDQNFGKGSRVIQNLMVTRLNEKLGHQMVDVPTCFGLSDYVEQFSVSVNGHVNWQVLKNHTAELNLLPNTLPVFDHTFSSRTSHFGSILNRAYISRTFTGA